MPAPRSTGPIAPPAPPSVQAPAVQPLISSGPIYTSSIVSDAEDEVRQAEANFRKLHEPVNDPHAASAEQIASNKLLCKMGVLARLKDPDGAKLSEIERLGASNVFIFGNTKVMALISYHVQVNARNSFGAYTGEHIWVCDFDMGETKLMQAHEVGG